MNTFQVEHLGPQEFTDETGETITFYAVRVTLTMEDSSLYGMTLSMTPDTEPGDMEYSLSIERAKESLLAHALQQVGDDPAEQATGQRVGADSGLSPEGTEPQ